MRIFIAGIDGYLGWTLAQYLTERGHTVGGLDNGLRRKLVREIGSDSATTAWSMRERIKVFDRRIQFWDADMLNCNKVYEILEEFKPDAIVHLAEIPSAPYSMINAAAAALTYENNVVGTLNLLHAMRDKCPDAHLLKLGTMGEYGTPNVDIPEGFFEIEYRGREARMPFPRQAGSWYHQTKVADSQNIEMACKIWGLRSTDIMQGVVYGTRMPNAKKREKDNVYGGLCDGCSKADLEDESFDERLLTRFDFDGVFGTAINRFVAQALIGHPITVYGTGEQLRGFLPLQDSMQCLTLALENPPGVGEYRVFNQFETVYSINELASIVARVGVGMGLGGEVRHLENPRHEAAEHYYNPDCEHLINLGYVPTGNIESVIQGMFTDLESSKRIIWQLKHVLIPDVQWKGERRSAPYING